jgi:hypothetical protein
MAYQTEARADLPIKVRISPLLMPRPAGTQRTGVIAAVFATAIADGVTPPAAQAFTLTTVRACLGGSDGRQPLAGLAAGPIRLWGTSCAGGTPNFGTAYKLKIGTLAYNQVHGEINTVVESSRI